MWAKSDPDMDSVRDHPRFKAMMAKAEARLAGGFVKTQTGNVKWKARWLLRGPSRRNSLY
jgi:hypothetical protein